MQPLGFASDYMQGAHEAILKKLTEINGTDYPGYGSDAITESAKNKIRAACSAPQAEVYFLVGGTQTNATVIDALLHGYEGVVSADTGHISVHEAGAIEFGGHKVLAVPHENGKLMPQALFDYLKTFYGDDNREHMVQPGMVYISQPTEYGTLYSKDELTAIRKICDTYGLRLYVDGARLAYALASPENDVTLKDLAALTDVFYIGGTKCGAMFGEAVVIPKKGSIPHFFTTIKQHGSLLAKGWMLGVQFDVLFTDDLYLSIGKNAVAYAARIQKTLEDRGYRMQFHSPTNQIFPVFSDEELARISESVAMGFWEKADTSHTVMRIATAWYTKAESVDALLALFGDKQI